MGDGKTERLENIPCWDRIWPFPEGGYLRHEIDSVPGHSQEAAEK